MKIDINRIPAEGERLEEVIPAAALELEDEIVKFRSPLKVSADVSKVSNVVSVDLRLQAEEVIQCSRCLSEFPLPLDKELALNFPVETGEKSIDLNPEIREEVILSYPLKFLCRGDCKGLCPRCGVNLNSEKCKCDII